MQFTRPDQAVRNERHVHTPQKHSSVQWTTDQTLALKNFIRQEEDSEVRARGELPSAVSLARRALSQLVPTGLVGTRSKMALECRIKLMRRNAGMAPVLSVCSKWTRFQAQALEEFIRREEEHSDVLISTSELARRAMTQLVPTGEVGQRSEFSMHKKIRHIRSNCGPTTTNSRKAIRVSKVIKQESAVLEERIHLTTCNGSHRDVQHTRHSDRDC